jgi:diphthamide synthase (EF-2-diphthine--ammonia ligase)
MASAAASSKRKRPLPAFGFEALICHGPVQTKTTNAREKQLRDYGLQPIFPVWGMSTRELGYSMITSGVRAKLACIDCNHLDPKFAGREFDEKLLSDLPPNTDPCGENGEFQSFVYAGPMLRHEVCVQVGKIVTRDNFIFADLLLADTEIARIKVGP